MVTKKQAVYVGGTILSGALVGLCARYPQETIEFLYNLGHNAGEISDNIYKNLKPVWDTYSPMIYDGAMGIIKVGKNVGGKVIGDTYNELVEQAPAIKESVGNQLHMGVDSGSNFMKNLGHGLVDLFIKSKSAHGFAGKLALVSGGLYGAGRYAKHKLTQKYSQNGAEALSQESGGRLSRLPFVGRFFKKV